MNATAPSITNAGVMCVKTTAIASVRLRRFPYPYRAMLAICSDLDETPDANVYLEMMRFLNTTETTAMGSGVGLEVGNTIYFDMAPYQFAYWNTDDAGREMIRNLIHSGHIDCLHSFGDSATTRDHAKRALDELTRYDCQMEVWVDHSRAPTNFGADIMHGLGDVPGSPVYHADATCDYGIKYVWRGRTTSVIGQQTVRSLGGLFNVIHPIRSMKTVLKEAAKSILAQCGNTRYAMHAPNDVLRTTVLRDGQPVYEFLRSNPHWSGPGAGATASGLGEVLSEAFLERLVAREGCCVLYTHMGKIQDLKEPFAWPTRAALRRLAEYHRNGRILVTTTRRLLGFRRARDEVTASASSEVRGLRIDVKAKATNGNRVGAMSASDLAGLTFYVPGDEPACVFVDGREMTELQENRHDETGHRSVSIPWVPLTFPHI